ncbi:hypothetical protein Droror1_Dr00020971 [Drosera rotundifolia]
MTRVVHPKIAKKRKFPVRDETISLGEQQSCTRKTTYGNLLLHVRFFVQISRSAASFAGSDGYWPSSWLFSVRVVEASVLLASMDSDRIFCALASEDSSFGSSITQPSICQIPNTTRLILHLSITEPSYTKDMLHQISASTLQLMRNSRIQFKNLEHPLQIKA